jgi:hypothetical protein
VLTKTSGLKADEITQQRKVYKNLFPHAESDKHFVHPLV